MEDGMEIPQKINNKSYHMSWQPHFWVYNPSFLDSDNLPWEIRCLYKWNNPFI